MKSHCVTAQEGCLRCQSVYSGNCWHGGALVLGTQDTDAYGTLCRVLEASAVSYFALGSSLVLPDIRPHLSVLGIRLRQSLSHYAQTCIRAVYTPNCANTLDWTQEVLQYAEPLSVLLENIEHEWVCDALHEDWLFSVFHPIVDVAKGKIFAYEALMRARNPKTNELIGAKTLIQACDRLNLQHQLDQRARCAAIRDAASLKIPTIRVFINFLPNTIYDPKICLRKTMEMAETYAIRPDQLVFEVVETEQIPDMKHLCHILNYYRERGIGTAVDDMGAGYTSMEYLMTLRPDYVKIDRDVVVQAENDVSAHNAFKNMVIVAKGLGVRVIAEGIETPTQMKICIDAGVDFLQGFLFARPANPPQSVANEHFHNRDTRAN